MLKHLAILDGERARLDAAELCEGRPAELGRELAVDLLLGVERRALGRLGLSRDAKEGDYAHCSGLLNTLPRRGDLARSGEGSVELGREFRQDRRALLAMVSVQRLPNPACAEHV